MARVFIEGEGVMAQYTHLLTGCDKQGRQSMERIKDLSMYNFAQSFVNLYLERGEAVAAQFALDQFPNGGVDAARDYVALAFEKRGFVINKG